MQAQKVWNSLELFVEHLDLADKADLYDHRRYLFEHVFEIQAVIEQFAWNSLVQPPLTQADQIQYVSHYTLYYQ